MVTGTTWTRFKARLAASFDTTIAGRLLIVVPVLYAILFKVPSPA